MRLGVGGALYVGKRDHHADAPRFIHEPNIRFRGWTGDIQQASSVPGLFIGCTRLARWHSRNLRGRGGAHIPDLGTGVTMDCWIIIADDRTASHISVGRDSSCNGVRSFRFPLSAATGDAVVIWRRGTKGVGSGVVAVGRVTSSSLQADEFAMSVRRAFPSRSKDLSANSRREPEPTFSKVEVRFDALVLGKPVLEGLLRAKSLGTLVDQARKTVRSNRLIGAVHLSVDQWQEISYLAEHSSPPKEWPLAWDIAPGSVVERSALHHVYGGTLGPITACNRTPNMFLFIERKAEKIRPATHWVEDTLLAPGYPGDSRSTVAVKNIELLGHIHRGLPLRIFETHGGKCLYVGEFTFDQEKPIDHIAGIGRKRIRYSRMDRLRRDSITGERVSRRSEIEQTVPIMRLLQLDGIRLFDGEPNPFESAPGFQLSLRSVVERSADGLTHSDTTPGASAMDSYSPDSGHRNSHAVANSDTHISASTQTLGNAPTVEVLRRLIHAFEQDPAALEMLGEFEEAQVLTTSIQHARREKDLERLEMLIADPNTRERHLQEHLQTMTWIFGAEFLTKTARRNLHVKHQVDLSLIRPDGSLHVVELKVARIGKLVEQHRQGLVLGEILCKAVGQARNYLLALDENRHQILADLGIDTRRASATIVAGHAAFVSNGVTPDQIAETLRCNNAHDPRVKIITYDQLIDTARRAIAVAEPVR